MHWKRILLAYLILLLVVQPSGEIPQEILTLLLELQHYKAILWDPQIRRLDPSVYLIMTEEITTLLSVVVPSTKIKQDLLILLLGLILFNP